MGFNYSLQLHLLQYFSTTTSTVTKQNSSLHLVTAVVPVMECSSGFSKKKLDEIWGGLHRAIITLIWFPMELWLDIRCFQQKITDNFRTLKTLCDCILLWKALTLIFIPTGSSEWDIMCLQLGITGNFYTDGNFSCGKNG